MPDRTDPPDGEQAPASDPLTPSAYEELRRIARTYMSRLPAGQTLQPTALVHEAFLRIADLPESRWGDEQHFIAAVAKTMRYELVDEVRRKASRKRGGDRRRVLLHDVSGARSHSPIDLLALDEAARKLERLDPRKGRVLDLRAFGGLTLEETATALGLSFDIVKRDWRFIKQWLSSELTGDEATPPAPPG